MSDVKVLFCDLGNVVVRLKDRDFHARLLEACPGLRAGALRDYLEDPRGPRFRHEVGGMDAPRFHRALVRDLGLSWGFEEFLGHFNDYFTPNRPMVRTLSLLRGRVRLWALSNTNEAHILHLKNRYRLHELFEGLILSNELGTRKPEKEIYRQALKRAGVGAGQAAYVDDVGEFVGAARALGIESFQYRFNDAEFRRWLEGLGLKPGQIRGAKAYTGC